MQLDANAMQQLKLAMGYRDGKDCCKNCNFFVPTDCSGNHNAKHSHCRLNPAVEVPVDESGFCEHFLRK